MMKISMILKVMLLGAGVICANSAFATCSEGTKTYYKVVKGKAIKLKGHSYSCARAYGIGFKDGVRFDIEGAPSLGKAGKTHYSEVQYLQKNPKNVPQSYTCLTSQDVKGTVYCVQIP